MFEALGSRTFLYRYLIVLVWAAAAVISYLFAPSIAGQGTADQAAFLPASVPSAVALRAIDRAFPGSTSTSSATITFSRDAGLTDADRRYLDSFAAWVTSTGAPPDLRDAVTSVDSATSRPELAAMLESSDGQLALLNVNLNVSSAGDEAEAVVSALREHASTAPSGLAVHVTGSTGITTDYLRAIKAGTESTTLVTVVLVLVILLLIYRAPLAALVPLATIGAAFFVARGVLGWLSAAGWQLSSLLDTFVVVLVFGVGTDYTIFLISRYREEVREGDWHDASRRTVRRIGAVISASAATVIVGLGAMAFGDFEMIRSTGPALGVAIFVTLIAGLTLAPALLNIFGHYLFWPLHTRTGSGEEPEGFFAGLAAFVSRHPGVVTVAVVGALLIPAAFLPQMKTNFDTLAELPATSDARAGYEVVAAHLGKGKLVQSTGLIDAGGGGDILAPASLARLRDTMVELSKTPGVGSVTSLVTPEGDGVVPEGLRPSVQLTTMADSFSSSDGSSADASSSGSSAVDPKVSSGLSDALDYVDALGVAFPDVAARSEFRDSTAAIAAAQSIVERARAQSVVSTQLRTLSSALTSPTAVASGGSGGSSDSGLVGDYLAELATAYPEVRDLAAFRAATAAATSLERTPTASAAIAAADALDRLAVHFDGKPEATLAAKSLSNTPTALEAKRQATAAFTAIPDALRGLAAVFAGRSDDIFVPAGLGGSEAASLQKAIDAFVSTDRTATRFYLTAADDPYATSAFTMVRTVQDELAAAAPSFGPGASAALDGPTAQLSDVQTVLGADFERVGVVTVIGILIVLILLLRAIVAPLYLVATVLLSYASAVGLSAWLFQGPLGQNGVSFYLPLLVFVLLVALGSDYNIFLMSRVREESETRPIRDGIRVASGHTGAVITSAGLILAGTFGSMATAPLAVLFQIGAAVAIGVLIDTFVVRSILVPAITTLVGDRAWWPSGWRLAGSWLAPGPAAAGSAVLATTDERPRRSPLRLAVAVALAVLVPVTFTALIVWARPGTGTPPAHAAVVNADEGAATSAPGGGTRSLRLGADLAATLAAGDASDPVSWTVVDEPAAEVGLADGTYDAVLRIPAGYSRAIAAIGAGAPADGLAPTLHLETGDASGATTQEVARALTAAVAATASREAIASYVDDMLLAVATTQGDLSGAASDAHDVATRVGSLASNASGVHTVAGELVSGLDKLASGASGAAGGALKVAGGTNALARGAQQLADGAGSLAGGAAQTAAGASKLSSGASDLAGGLDALKTQTGGLPGQVGQLDSGAASLASGATSSASGAGDLAAGLATLRSQTSGLPSQIATLDSGATALAGGAASAASGASALSSGLATLQTGTTGLGAQVAALDSGAESLVSGATQLATGAVQADAGASGVADAAGQLSAGIDAYTSSVAALAQACPGMGGGAVCAALDGIVAGNAALTSGGHDLVSGAQQVQAGTHEVAGASSALASGATDLRAGTSALAAAAPGLESGIAQAAGGAASLSSGTASLASGASSLAGGVHQLAAGIPALSDGIAKLASGASSLSSGLSTLASGASSLADGTHKLAAGMPALSDGIARLSGGAASLASGASTLADGTSSLASGASGVASGAKKTASGAASLATGTSAAASGVRQLVSALGQAADGARIADAQTGRLASDGTILAGDATDAATSLEASAGSTPTYPADVRTRIAGVVAAPVSVDAVAAGGAAGGLAPYVAALALWLGALGALVVLPAGRRRGGRRAWTAPTAAFAAAAALMVAAAALMVAGLAVVGLSIARPLEALAVAMLAGVTFVAIVQALVVAFGRRGWLVGLLFAGIQVAASGLVYPADALPGPLAFLHRLVPLTWASDALATSIGGGTAGIVEPVVVLVAWLVGALAVSLMVVGRSDRPEATADVGTAGQPQATGTPA